MLKLFIASLKILVRNRPFIFWSFMFPLLFTLMFGSFFGNGGGGMSLGTIGLVNQSKTPVAVGLGNALSGISGLHVKHLHNMPAAREQLRQGNITAIVAIPPGFGSGAPGSSTRVSVIADPGSPQTGGVIAGIVERCVTGLDYVVRGDKPVYSVEHVQASRRGLNYFDFILVGLIAMALMNSSVQGVAVGMSRYREDKILKRITTTPLPQWRFITANVLSRLVINAIQIAFILVIGTRVFHASIYGSIPLLCTFSMLGAILFQLVGFSIASVSKTTQAAEGMSTTFTVPMMLLSGIFMPIESLPAWLGGVVHYLPMAPLLSIMRGIALQGRSPFADTKNLIILACWVLGLFAFTCSRFRLADD